MSADAFALEAPELAGYLDLFRAAPVALAREHGISVADIDGIVCTAVCEGGLNARMFNHVIGLGVVAPATHARLEQIERHYAGLGTSFCVFLSPGSAPAQELLAARGYEADYPWVKFRRSLEPPSPPVTDLRIAPCGPEHGEALGHVVASAFGFPPFFGEWLACVPGRPGWHCFGGFDGDELVAGGGLFVAGNAGWTAFAGTLGSHRGRGGQGAIFAARIEAARALGCRLLVTETGEQVDGRPSNSYRNILRAGFERAYVRPNLLPPRVAEGR